jgi:hypothetical protein
MRGTRVTLVSRIVAAFWLALGTLVLPLPAIAAGSPMPLYRESRGSSDGIGKFYQGREIAAVMGFEGVTKEAKRRG